MNIYATLGALAEGRVAGQADLARKFLKILNDETLSDLDREEKLFRLIKKTINAERKFYKNG